VGVVSTCADASVKDMEGAAVAWAAELYDIPYFALKVVTDIGTCGFIQPLPQNT
jgi:nucleoside phosphorylase